jgi:hypothetical protein
MLLLTAACMGYYNWRLTGNPLLLPHTLNTRNYQSAGLFLWDHKKPEIHYRNQEFEVFHNNWERNNYNNTWPDILRVSKEKVVRYGLTYFWIGVLLAVPAFPFLFRDRKIRLLLMIFLLVSVGSFSVVWSNAHYAAPATCIVFTLIVQVIRHLRTMRVGGRSVGIALSRAIVFLLVLDIGVNTRRGICDPLEWACLGNRARAAIGEKLQHTSGKHLVMVRYDEPNHNIHEEWVYNGAEIDNAKVIWAREIGPEQDGKLFAYFKDRKVWVVTPDGDTIYLEPYTPPPFLSHPSE